MLRYFFLLFAFIIVVVVSVAGFRGSFSKLPPVEVFPDMDHQPKVKAQTGSTFFADSRATRVPVTGTVPLGYSAPLHKPDPTQVGNTGEESGPYRQIRFTGSPDYYNTGKMGANWGTGIPFEVTEAVMKRGQERYTVSCSVCHGATGTGNGITSKYGIVAIANLHQQRLKDMADGEIFNTITNGKNTMMGYGYNIQVPDRWAIIAYIRALQRSQGSPVTELPPEYRKAFEAKTP